MFENLKKNESKKSIIAMLETVKEALSMVDLKSEIILIDEIIDNVNDSINENSKWQESKLNMNSSNLEKNDSIIINNNEGQINNVNGCGSVNAEQIIKYNITGGNIGNIGDNVKHKRFVSNDYKYIGEED